MTLEIVRALIPDNYQYDRATAIGDGATKQFKMPYYPMLAGTITVYIDAVEQATANYVVECNLGLITFVAAPGNGTAIVATYQHSILSDAAINSFLVIEGNDKLAAALALETIASDTAMVLKVIKLLDLTTDGAKVSDALLKRAGVLREQAADEVSEIGAFDYAEMGLDSFSVREFLRKDALRRG